MIVQMKNLVIFTFVMITIYKIENLENNKIYIGQSIDFQHRRVEHLRKIKNFTHENCFLNEESKHYAFTAFTISEIETCSTQKEADELEKKYIKLLNALYTQNGYNISPGGKGIKNIASITKPVYQFDGNGILIKKHTSSRQASRDTKLNCGNISKCCNGLIKIYNKFIWLHDETMINKRLSEIKPWHLPAYQKKIYIKTDLIGKYSKKNVAQYDVDGKLIYVYDSIKEASKFSQTDSANIGKALNKKNNFAGGFFWHLVKDNIPVKQKITIPAYLRVRRIWLCDKSGNKIQLFNNQCEVSNYIGGNTPNVNHCLKKRKKSYKGYMFIYE